MLTSYGVSYGAPSPYGVSPYGAPPPYGVSPYGAPSPYGVSPYGDPVSMVASGIQSGVKFLAVWRAFGGVIIMLVLVMIGSSILEDKHTASAPMTVTSVTGCTRQPDGSYLCAVTVSFKTPDGKSYTPPTLSLNQPAPLTVGTVISLGYNPKNPNDVNTGVPPPKMVGRFLIVGGLAIGGLTVGLAVLAFKPKTNAAFKGVNGIYNLSRGRYGGAHEDATPVDKFYGGDPAAPIPPQKEVDKPPPTAPVAHPPTQNAILIKLAIKSINGLVELSANKNNSKTLNMMRLGAHYLTQIKVLLKSVNGIAPWFEELDKCIANKDWGKLAILGSQLIEELQKTQTPPPLRDQPQMPQTPPPLRDEPQTSAAAS
jgi:hypothetical protein